MTGESKLDGPRRHIAGIANKCIDIDGGYPGQGAPLIINDCNGSPSQQWVSHQR